MKSDESESRFELHRSRENGYDYTSAEAPRDSRRRTLSRPLIPFVNVKEEDEESFSLFIDDDDETKT